MFKLVQTFDELDKDGYCEEDILDAFISNLSQRRVETNDDEDAQILQERILDLTATSYKWIEQNLNRN